MKARELTLVLVTVLLTWLSGMVAQQQPAPNRACRSRPLHEFKLLLSIFNQGSYAELRAPGAPPGPWREALMRKDDYQGAIARFRLADEEAPQCAGIIFFGANRWRVLEMSATRKRSLICQAGSVSVPRNAPS